MTIKVKTKRTVNYLEELFKNSNENICFLDLNDIPLYSNKALKNTIKKITKIKPKLSTTGGTSDARFIRKISPCLEFGMVGASMHQVDENIKVSDLKTLTKIHKEILENYFL